MYVMANYSAQKLKSVSLNNQERRYANQDGNNTARPENRTVTAAKKPLITPLSPVAVKPPTSGGGYKATHTVVRSR